MSWTSDLTVRTPLPNAKYVTQNAGRQIILVLMLLCYHLWFQIDFGCPCSPDQNLIHCYGYMVLPCFIITSIIVWNDKRIGRIFRYGCYHSSDKKRKCNGKFCFEFFIYILQAATSGFLWCGSVLIDGDWYVCCGASSELISSCCLNNNEICPADMQEKVDLKNQSQVIGLICILMTAACYLILILPWNKWCTKRNHFRVMFEEALLENTENILLSEMGKAAADAVKKSLLSLSSAQNTTTSSKNNHQGRAETPVDDERRLLNMNTDWEKVACIAGFLTDSVIDNNNND